MSFASSALADCTAQYEKTIARKIKNAKTTKVFGWTGTGLTTAGAGAAASVSGYAVYGTLGIIFGVQVSLIVALPLAGSFLVINGVNRQRIEGLVKAHQLVLAVQNDSNTTKKPLFDLLKKLKKTKPSVSMDALKAEITHLNDSRMLCDGTVSDRRLPGMRDIYRYLKTNI